MNEQHRDQADEAFARLRASDPASGAALDRDALRHEVDRRIAGSDATGTPVEGGSAVVAPIRRPRTRWLQVAAAVAGVAVVAGAGFWVGRGSETTTAAPAISLAQGANPAAADSAESLAVDRMWSPGRVVFQAGGGLGDATTTATAWGFDAQAVLNAEQVSRVAAALGLTGDPVEQDGTWTVGAQDGSAPSLVVYADGTASFSYYDPTRDPWMCGQSVPEAGSADSSETIEPGIAVQSTECAETGEAPSGDAAVAELRNVMAEMGVDPDSFQFGSPEIYDPSNTFVSATMIVDGQDTGLVWSATLVGDGVQSLSGQLAPLVELGSYDVIGATTAVQRMADPRFGSGWGGVMPLAAADSAGGPAVLRDGVTADGTASTSAPEIAPEGTATPDDTASAGDGSTASPDESIAAPTEPSVLPGSPIEWPVQTVTITEARLGLAQVVQSNGAVVLAPSYAFTGDDGSQWSVIAVAESGLAIG